MSVPDQSGPFERSWLRLAFVVAVVVGYAFLSLALAPSMGTSTGVLAVIPVTIGGLMFGTRGGALVGLAAIPSNALLIDLAGGGNNGVIIGVADLPGATALVIAGSLIGKLRDLSARVAAQLADRSMAHDEVRRLSRQNYLLLNAVGDGVCGLDLNGNATFINSAAARLLGWRFDELTGKPFSEFFKTSPIDGRGDYLMIDAITRGLAPGEVSLMLERRDGTSLPVEVVSLPVLDERAVLTGAVVTFRDIGDRVQNRMIVENLTEAISITVGSRRVFANRAFFRMFDAPDMTSALDLPLDGMIAEEDRASILRARAEFLSGEAKPGLLSFRVLRSDGDVRAVETTSAVISYRGERALLELLRDVTDQRDAEAAASASDARYRAIFDGATEGVATLSPERRFIGANPSFLEKLGYRAEELEGRTLASVTHPEDQEAGDRRWEQLLNGAEYVRGERRFIRKDGSVLWGQVSGHLVRSSDGAPDFVFIMVEDVTERKEAHDALLESEAKWRSLVENAPTLIMNVTKDGKLLFTNRGVPGMTPEDLVGTSLYDYIPSEQHALIASALDRAFVTGEPDSYEIQGITEDGEIAWYAGRLNPVVHDGVVVAATLISVDVTGLKSAQEEITNQLEEGTRRLEAFRAVASRLALEGDQDQASQQLIDVATDVVGARHGVVRLWDGDRRRPLLVAESAQVQGMPQKAILEALQLARDTGKVARIDHESADPEDAVATRLGKSLGSVLCVPFWCKDGRVGVLAVFGTPTSNFNDADERLISLFSALSGIMLDNISLYQAQIQERAALTAIQTSMAEGLVVLDPSGHVRYFNRAAEELTGMTMSFIAGKRLADVFAKRASEFEDPEVIDALVGLMEAPPEVARSLTLGVTSPERRDVGVTIFPIPSGRGDSMTGMLLRNVTEEREIERRRDTFVSVASHELRTPMTTIAGFSELLLTREASPEVQRSWLNLIHQDSKHVTAIVDDMLNVARIQSGHMQLEPEGVDVLEVAREVTVGMAGMSDRHRLVVEESAEAALAIADRFKLAQVLTNLLENGIKYSPEGGDIKVRAINDPSTERLVVSVTDEGMGITQENGDRLFSTFHRIRRPETEKIRGTGLGLYIVKALVELMGGEIWLNSRINHGTTFFFSLPTVERAVVVDAA